MWDTIWNFILNNWLYFAIGGGVIIVLLLIIIIISVKHHKKKKLAQQKNKALKEDDTQNIVENTQQSEEVKIENKEILSTEIQDDGPEEKEDTSKTLEILLEMLENKPAKRNTDKTDFSSINIQTHETDRKESLKNILLSKQTELENTIKEFETLKSLNQELDDVEQNEQEADQMDIITKLIHEKKEEQNELLADISHDKEFLKELSNRDYLNALNEALNKKSEQNEKQQSTEPNPPEKEISDETFELDDDDELEEEQLEEPDNTKFVSKNAIVLQGVKKLTYKEAYAQLTKTQKQYINKLIDYADKKPNARAKETIGYVTVGCGNKPYIRIVIKRKTVFAYFMLEDENSQRLRLSGNNDIKPEGTRIKVCDDNSFVTAKQMIDLRVEQVAREKQIIKELRKERRKQQSSTLNKKKK